MLRGHHKEQLKNVPDNLMDNMLVKRAQTTLRVVFTGLIVAQEKG